MKTLLWQHLPCDEARAETLAAAAAALMAGCGTMAIELSPEAITRVSGTYATGPMTLKIYQEGDQMMALMSGQQPVEIFAETPDSFYLTVVPATLEFAPGEVAPALVLKQNGQEIEFTRAP